MTHRQFLRYAKRVLLSSCAVKPIHIQALSAIPDNDSYT